MTYAKICKRGSLSRLTSMLAVILFVSVINHTLYPGTAYSEKTTNRCPIGMSEYDCAAILGGWPWYIPDDARSSDCSDGANIPNGTVEQNGQAIFTFLTASGRLQPHQAAGIIGNMAIESDLQPQRLQGTSSSTVTTAETYKSKGMVNGWGLVQWTPGSKFIDTVKPIEKANQLGTQIQFVWDQLEGKTAIPEKQAGDDVKAAPDIKEAVLAFQGNKKVGGKYVGYERPRDQSGTVGSRLAIAVGALSKYGQGSSSSNSVVFCTEGNSAAGGYSLPVEQKWFDKNPEWFTKPHHDYPSADIPVPTGTPVYALLGGKVTKAPITTENKSYGQGVEVDSGDGVIVIYGHGNDGGSIEGAKVGDIVRPGQLLMHSASTGNSTGPHLHLEIRLDGVEVCPQNLLKAIGNNSPTLPSINSLPKSGCSY